MCRSTKKVIPPLSRKMKWARCPFLNGSSAQQPGAWYRKRSAIGSMGWKPVHKSVYGARTHRFILCTGSTGLQTHAIDRCVHVYMCTHKIYKNIHAPTVYTYFPCKG